MQTNETHKVDLKGLSLDELQHYCVKNGHTKYRGTQLFEWIYRQGEANPQKMLNLSKPFRQYLEKNCNFKLLNIETKETSEIDNTVKFLFKTSDNKFIESVSIIDGKRHTVCVSSQIGCNVNCDFCATATMGLVRNLTAGEIIEQMIMVRRYTQQDITNVVFMGMGEPLLNYKAVMTAADILHHPLGFNLGSLKITISTSGILPQIKKYIQEERKYKLAISLNASNNSNRTQIMPINKKWSIEDLVKVGKHFANKKRRNIMFEYVLLEGVNDAEENAFELASLLKNVKCKINLIPFNESGGKYKRPPEEQINRFATILQQQDSEFRVLVRWSKGEDISAACGQLATETE
jgi:23S rRNA (adenine2503-C2)-methyltransferase